MIPFYKKITHSLSSSFSAVVESPPEFDTPWHYHPEYELILILNSEGTRFMGDSVSSFNEVELVLIGPNLPHFWQNDQTSKLEKDSKAYVIHFSKNFLGEEIFDLPEGKRLTKILNEANFGLVFKEKKTAEIIKKIKKLVKKSGFDKVIDLLVILNILSRKRNYKKLSSEGFMGFFSKNNSDKIDNTIEYAMNNFKNKIKLEDVASLVYMSKSSFCRYFKKSTGKTYFDFLREIRIGYACKLILENNHNITQIAYECGYENISNFNRQFKDTKLMSPKLFKEKLLKNDISI